MPELDFVHTITKCLSDNLGENLAVLDMRKVSSLADFFVIVTGNSTPHISALSERLDKDVKASGQRVYRKSGTSNTGWMVLDYVDVVVHVMSAEMRDYYDLEGLWSDAPTLAVAS